MSIASSSRSFVAPQNQLRCNLCLVRRYVSELAHLPPENEGKQQPFIPLEDQQRPPYLPTAQDDARIRGLPHPRGQVQTKPIFEWDTSLTERENLKREKLHEKWRKRSPFATAELYGHHEVEKGATGTKAGLMAMGAAIFVIVMAYVNAERLKREAHKRQLLQLTPPDRPPRSHSSLQVDAEGLAGDASLAAIPRGKTPALDQPGPVGYTMVSAQTVGEASAVGVEANGEARGSWLASLEKGNARLV